MQEPTRDHPLSIGDRMRFYRRRRGISQVVLAGLVGKSLSWVEKVEGGRLGVDRMSTVLELARVLRVSPQDLTGQPFLPAGPLDGSPTIDEIRRALIENGTSLDQEPPPLASFRRQVDRINELRQAAKYIELAEVVPDAIRGGRLACATLTGRDGEVAAAALTEIYHAAQTVAKNLGYLDLAWIIAERAHQQAPASGDPLLEAADNNLRTNVVMTMGASDRAQTIAERAAAQLQPGLGHASAPHRSLYGKLHLANAIVAARRGKPDTAWASVREAEDAAHLLGADRNDYQTMFGPTNVAIHRVSVAVELGEPGLAVEHSANVDLSRLPSAERRGHYYIDLASAYGMRRSDQAATRALMQAEDQMPERVHYHPMVRELLSDLLRRERRRSNPDLRGLAERSGVLA